MADRRSHSRQPCFVAATATSGALRCEVVCTNLGPGGAFVASTAELLPGTRLELVLRPLRPDGALVALPALVVYTVRKGGRRQAGFGVRWLLPADRPLPAALQRMLDDLALAAASPLPANDPATVTAAVPRYDAPAPATDKYAVLRHLPPQTRRDDDRTPPRGAEPAREIAPETPRAQDAEDERRP